MNPYTVIPYGGIGFLLGHLAACFVHRHRVNSRVVTLALAIITVGSLLTYFHPLI